MKHEEYREMIELAALDALGEDDLRRLQAHLATCDECRAELAELRDAFAMLMYDADAVATRTELNARILDIPQTTTRVRPLVQPEVSEDVDNGRGQRDVESAPTLTPALQRPRRRQHWSGVPWPSALAAAVVLVALVIALIIIWNRNRALQAELSQLSNRNSEIQAELNRLKQNNDEVRAELERTAKQNEALQAELDRLPNRPRPPGNQPNPPEPESTPTTTQVTPPPANENYSRSVELTATGVAPRARAHLAYDSRTRVIEMTAFDMPPAPAGKAYQLWLIIGGKPVPAGTFSIGTGGRAMMRGQVAADALAASAFAVTLEPAGGSSQPTGPKYLLGSAL